jgi:hypothetical protein
VGIHGMDQYAQLGLVTRKGLVAKDIKEHFVDYRAAEGSLIPVHRGVYRFRGAPESFESKAHALTLYGGPRCAISHFSAAYLHGLEGFKEPSTLELIMPLAVHVKPRGVLIHRTREPFQIYKYKGLIRTTSLARTLIDISPHLPSRELEVTLNSAWRLHRTIGPWLLQEIGKLRRKKNRNGIFALVDLVNRMDGRGLDSTLEVDASRILEKSGLPPPTRGLVILDEKGNYVMRGDLGWERQRTVLHLDSVAFHSTERAMVRDARQRSKLSLMKWTQIVVMKRTLHDGLWVEHLREALSRPLVCAT